MTALWSPLRSEHCSSCAGERLFEQPACLDGHEPGTCPSWACAECGHALFIGGLPQTPPTPHLPLGARVLVTAAA